MAKRYSMRRMYSGARTIYRAARRRAGGMSTKARKAIKTNKMLTWGLGLLVALVAFLMYKKVLSVEKITSAFKG